jgi:hypothetical protein
MQTLAQVVLAFVIAALFLIALVVVLAIQVIKMLADGEGAAAAEHTLEEEFSRLDTERQ